MLVLVLVLVLVAGSQKPQEAHAVKDSTGKSEDIQRVNLEHCVKVLSKNAPDPEVIELLKAQSDLHDTLMKEDTEKETTITEEEYNKVLGKFKKKNKKSHFFLTRSGQGFQKSVYKLCKRMIDDECFPQDFSLTTLYQLW